MTAHDIVPITALVDPDVCCPCTCCVEAVNRLLHGRSETWCSCTDYDEPERCDCGPCLAALRRNRCSNCEGSGCSVCSGAGSVLDLITALENSIEQARAERTSGRTDREE